MINFVFRFLIHDLFPCLIGLPGQHFLYVQNIEPGLPLFLFSYSDRKLHGIFEAASSGKINIDSYAWTHGGSDKTQFPAQVSQNYLNAFIYVFLLDLLFYEI